MLMLLLVAAATARQDPDLGGGDKPNRAPGPNGPDGTVEVSVEQGEVMLGYKLKASAVTGPDVLGTRWDVECPNINPPLFPVPRPGDPSQIKFEHEECCVTLGPRNVWCTAEFPNGIARDSKSVTVVGPDNADIFGFEINSTKFPDDTARANVTVVPRRSFSGKKIGPCYTGTPIVEVKISSKTEPDGDYVPDYGWTQVPWWNVATRDVRFRIIRGCDAVNAVDAGSFFGKTMLYEFRLTFPTECGLLETIDIAAPPHIPDPQDRTVHV